MKISGPLTWIAWIIWNIFQIQAQKSERILIFQIISEEVVRHPWEWDHEVYPFSLVDLSKLNVYLYAQRHGYAYQLIRAAKTELQGFNRTVDWLKVHALPVMLQGATGMYDYVVYVDIDRAFIDFETPLTVMIKQWGSTSVEQVDVFLPLEPVQLSRDRQTFNTGFQVWKVSEKSVNIANLWNQYTGVGTDQDAFNHFKDLFQQDHSLRIQTISCSEANGFSYTLIDEFESDPSVTNYDCTGSFISRFLWGEALNAVIPMLMNQLGKVVVERYLSLLISTQLWLKLSPGPIDDVIRLQISCHHINGNPFEAIFERSVHLSHNEEEVQDLFVQMGNVYNLSRSVFNTLYYNFRLLYFEKLDILNIEENDRQTVKSENKIHYSRPDERNRDRILLLQIVTEDYLYHEWEWFRQYNPLSMIDVSKISVYSYALQHGYAYHLLKVSRQDLAGRHPTWCKVYGLLNFMKSVESDELYDFIVLFDVDTLITSPEIPLHEKIDEWKGEMNLRDMDVMMSDVDKSGTNISTAFQIWTNSRRSRDVLEAWFNCTTMKICDSQSSEQDAFNRLFIQSKQDIDSNLFRFPCEEASGFPNSFAMPSIRTGSSICSGRFLSHFSGETKKNIRPRAVLFLYKHLMDLHLQNIIDQEVWVNSFNQLVPPAATSEMRVGFGDGTFAEVELVIELSKKSLGGLRDDDYYRQKLLPSCAQLPVRECDNLIQTVLEMVRVRRSVLRKDALRISARTGSIIP
jgi:hypothetical protein